VIARVQRVAQARDEASESGADMQVPLVNDGPVTIPLRIGRSGHAERRRAPAGDLRGAH